MTVTTKPEWRYGWHRPPTTPTECGSCGVCPCVNPRFCAACREADRRLHRQKRLQDSEGER